MRRAYRLGPWLWHICQQNIIVLKHITHTNAFLRWTYYWLELSPCYAVRLRSWGIVLAIDTPRLCELHPCILNEVRGIILLHTTSLLLQRWFHKVWKSDDWWTMPETCLRALQSWVSWMDCALKWSITTVSRITYLVDDFFLIFPDR